MFFFKRKKGYVEDSKNHNDIKIINYDLDSTFEGIIKNGKPNGLGTWKDNIGNKYIGNYEDGLRSGWGLEIYIHNDKNIGDWQEGEKNGLGLYIENDGAIKLGNWKDNVIINVYHEELPEYTTSIVKLFLIYLIYMNKKLCADDLLKEIVKEFGWKTKWAILDVVRSLLEDYRLSLEGKSYLESLIEDKNLEYLIKGQNNEKIVKSTIDELFSRSIEYRSSSAYAEMIEFVAKFRNYSPYNNMLVKIQNPHCGYYATKKDWKIRFNRFIKEDARPMLILAPMHPIMLVYDLDETEGDELPQKLKDFANYEGKIDESWLDKLIENANKYRIRVDFNKLSSISAGFATIDTKYEKYKMRISINEDLDTPSKIGILCHELAHIFLGHLGSDKDKWWPNRVDLDLYSVETEAESVAYIVTQRLGMKGCNESYLSNYIKNQEVPEKVSIEYITKVAAKIEDMAISNFREPKSKS